VTALHVRAARSSSTEFCPILKTFLVKPIFCRHFRKLLATSPSVEMTTGYTDTLLSLQIFLISRAKFSRSVIFSDSV
jgi:hypothetical protein